DPRLPPHIFNASAKAYKRCTQKKESQVLLLLGERCSGKSVAFEHLLGFLGTTAGDGDEEFRQLLRALRPLISVTRSCGRQSWLSTRAMLEADLGLDGDGFICRTLLTVRCLETQRITLGPKNFDALYLAAKDDRAHEWLGDNLEFRLLGDEIDFEEYDEQGTAGTSWMTSLKFFGIDHGELVRILCGLVLLGQLQFGGEPLQCQPPGALDAVANALGVGAGKLLAALLGGTAEEASQRRDAALQELYHRLVHLVLRQLNAKVAGEAQATPQSMKILEVPSALDAKGFHGMALQRLTEARFAHMLAICRPEDSDGLQDESEQQAAAQGAALQAWRLLRQPKESQEPVTIRGACGEAQYVVDKSFVTAAEGGGNGAGPMLEALSESSCKYLREITNSLAVKPASGTDAAEEALKALSSCLEPKAKAKTWPVCCLRPNDLGAADRVSRPVLLQQVRHLRLAEAAQLAEKGVNEIWSLQSFRARYAKLAPTLEESVEDEAACRLLVKAAGGDKGHVAESVFGGKILQQLMEHKLQESEAGHQHLEGTKSEMRLLMEQKLEADKLLRQQQQTQQEMEREAQRQAQQKELEAVRGQHEEHKLQQSQLLQQLQEQQKALQQQQQEQMEVDAKADSSVLVLKVGTSTIMTSDERGQRVNVANLSRLVEVISDLIHKNYKVVLVSSGAVGMGCRELGLEKKPTDPEMKRAVAGVGQSRIMRIYSELFETVGVRVAQLLVSQRDFLEQQRWTEIRNTIEACLQAGVVPIINENDTTNTDGMRFGDNDNLAALTAVQLQADGVFLFTDVDYLYTANPNVDPTAEPMKVVSEAFELKVDTREPGTALGTGGMGTKIAAARTAHCAGIPCGILHGKHPERIYSFLSALEDRRMNPRSPCD
ncbi:unnamed protein product, partial [Effrenium voratum]